MNTIAYSIPIFFFCSFYSQMERTHLVLMLVIVIILKVVENLDVLSHK